MKSKLKCWEVNSGLSPIKDFCKDCQAFIEKKNCWEVEKRPCTNSLATCILIKCPVYLENKEEIESLLNEEDVEQVKKSLLDVVDKRCWEFKNCPEDERNMCTAYLEKKSCWEVGICGIKRDDCHLCPIYIYHRRFEERITAT